MRVNICNVLIDNVDMKETISRIEAMLSSGNKHYIVTPNVDHIIKLQDDREFQNVYHYASLVLADGKPLIWASKYLGTPLKCKISGSDLFPEVCQFAKDKKFTIFLLGGRSGAVEKAQKRLENLYPSISIVGTYCPPFGFEKDHIENERIVNLINEKNPDILFVGLGAPKQEKWISRHISLIDIKVAIGIGVTFEFVAGMVKRAPVWMQNIGLEWLWRVLMEPRRLWKRYLVDDMKIFKMVHKFKISRRTLGTENRIS